MCHYRDKIEGCIKDILWDQTMAKRRVFTVSEAVYNQNFPMIILFSPKETVETPPSPMRPYRRLTLDIVGIVKGQKDLTMKSHLFAKQIEEAIAMDKEVFPSFVQQVDLTMSEVEIKSSVHQPGAAAASDKDEFGGPTATAGLPHENLLGYVKICYAIHYRAGSTTFTINSTPLVDPVPSI